LQTLREIWQILVSHPGRAKEAIQLAPDQTGKLGDFLKALEEGKFRTDEEAARELLGVPPSHYSYRRLKRKLRGSLLDALFFMDFPR
jgi:hypothetical protein